jgi:hypothetical protein
VHSWLKNLKCILGRMYTLPLNPAAAGSRDLDSGAKLPVRHLHRSKRFLLFKAIACAGQKDCRINIFVTMEAVKATKAQPC